MKNLSDRFWEKVPNRPQSGCWLWGASKKPNGYGQLNIDGVPRYAHRISFELENGAIERGHVVRHKCDTPLCVRPDHLEVGTQLDNIHDMESRGRSRKIGLPGERNPAAKLTDSQIHSIRENRSSSLSQLSRAFGVSSQRISQIQARKQHQSVKAGKFVEVAS